MSYYLVQVVGDDPFLISDPKVLNSTMGELYGGELLNKSNCDNGTIKIWWVDNIEEVLFATCYKIELIK